MVLSQINFCLNIILPGYFIKHVLESYRCNSFNTHADPYAPSHYHIFKIDMYVSKTKLFYAACSYLP